jgi:hypothetical protein
VKVQLFTWLLTFGIVSICGGCEIAFNCSFNLHFPVTNAVEHFSMGLVIIFIPSFMTSDQVFFPLKLDFFNYLFLGVNSVFWTQYPF